MNLLFTILNTTYLSFMYNVHLSNNEIIFDGNLESKNQPLLTFIYTT